MNNRDLVLSSLLLLLTLAAGRSGRRGRVPDRRLPTAPSASRCATWPSARPTASSATSPAPSASSRASPRPGAAKPSSRPPRSTPATRNGRHAQRDQRAIPLLKSTGRRASRDPATCSRRHQDRRNVPPSPDPGARAGLGAVEINRQDFGLTGWPAACRQVRCPAERAEP